MVHLPRRREVVKHMKETEKLFWPCAVWQGILYAKTDSRGVHHRDLAFVPRLSSPWTVVDGKDA
jgi:hypothetical protein